MSCSIVLAATLAASSVGNVTAPPETVSVSTQTVDPAVLLASIAQSADALSARLGDWLSHNTWPTGDQLNGEAMDSLRQSLGKLSSDNMTGHLTLKAQNADGDLACILRGISEDIPLKLAAFEQADTTEEQRLTLEELRHLLEDNAAVINAPSQPAV